MLEGFDPNTIEDVESARRGIVRLLNLVEELKQDNEALRAEVQRLRDENARLKGEPGKPNLKPNAERKVSSDYSSEKERQKPETWHKRSQVDQVKMDREQVLEVDKATLPSDAQFKGYEDVVVQDVVLRTDNVLFRKEKYYSASEQKTYLAGLPRGYDGEFGPGLKALVMAWHFGALLSRSWRSYVPHSPCAIGRRSSRRTPLPPKRPRSSRSWTRGSMRTGV